MSFGFSVGDLIGAANLTYRLITALRENYDAGEDYRAAIDELGCYQTALMKVSYLGRNKNVPRDTFDAASHMVMQSMDMIQSYLDQTKKYDQKLGKTDASGFRHGFRKVRWTLLKADDMKKLREALQRRNAGLQLLLQCAGFETDIDAPKHINDVKQLDNVSLPTASHLIPDHNKSVASEDDVLPNPLAVPLENAFSSSEPKEVPPKLPNIEGSPTSKLFSLSSFSAEQLRSLISDQTSREAEIRTLSILLRTLVRLGEYQLSSAESTSFIASLDILCQNPEDLEHYRQNSSIKLKDAVGRKFSFPWRLCKTWKGMEELIKQAFRNVEVIGPHVYEGHYDLVGPDGEIILPQVWETLIEPGWSLTMHMWPMADPPESPPEVPIPPQELPKIVQLPSDHTHRSRNGLSTRKTRMRKMPNQDTNSPPLEQSIPRGRNRNSDLFFARAAGKESRSSESPKPERSSSKSSTWSTSSSTYGRFSPVQSDDDTSSLRSTPLSPQLGPAPTSQVVTEESTREGLPRSSADIPLYSIDGNKNQGPSDDSWVKTHGELTTEDSGQTEDSSAYLQNDPEPVEEKSDFRGFSMSEKLVQAPLSG